MLFFHTLSSLFSSFRYAQGLQGILPATVQAEHEELERLNALLEEDQAKQKMVVYHASIFFTHLKLPTSHS